MSGTLTQEQARLLEAYLTMSPEARAQLLKMAELMAIRLPAERATLRLVSNHGGKTFL